MGDAAGQSDLPYPRVLRVWIPPQLEPTRDYSAVVILIVSTIVHVGAGLFFATLLQVMVPLGAAHIGAVRFLAGFEFILAILVGATAYEIWEEEDIGTLLAIPLGLFAMTLPLVAAALEGGLPLLLIAACLLPGVLDLLAGVVNLATGRKV